MSDELADGIITTGQNLHDLWHPRLLLMLLTVRVRKLGRRLLNLFSSSSSSVSSGVTPMLKNNKTVTSKRISMANQLD
ncbi:MAG: hypothetical protein M3P08_04270 [Thermoproteota archaeon]|nr:hypothetical protein [Thermoproteota archaeon]